MTAVPTLTDSTDTANRPRKTAALIRVAVLDDHAAVRAGLEAILGSAPDTVSVGSAHGEAELHWLLRRTDASVLILDAARRDNSRMSAKLLLPRDKRASQMTSRGRPQGTSGTSTRIA